MSTKIAPILIKGNVHSDQRGQLFYNNAFDASLIKRMYVIENKDGTIVRGWQGHRIEQRWFSAIKGSFAIQLVGIDDWDRPSQTLPIQSFLLSADTLDVFHIPAGYCSCIQALEEGSKLLVLADYHLGETQDEYRFDLEYFNGVERV